MTVKIDGKVLAPGDIILSKTGTEMTVVEVATYAEQAWIEGKFGTRQAATFAEGHHWRLKKKEFEVSKKYVATRYGPYDLEAGGVLECVKIDDNVVYLLYVSNERRLNSYSVWTASHDAIAHYNEVK